MLPSNPLLKLYREQLRLLKRSAFNPRELPQWEIYLTAWKARFGSHLTLGDAIRTAPELKERWKRMAGRTGKIPIDKYLEHRMRFYAPDPD